MTPQDVITEARRLIQDTDSSRQRYSDAVLLGFVNQVLKRMVHFRPDLFITTGTIATADDTVDQALPSGGVRVVEIFQVTSGDALQEVDRATLDRMYPGWRSEAAGTPINWMRHQRHPWRYHLYPAPSAAITLEAEYVKTPATYGIGDTITELPDSYLGTLIDGTVFLAESIDAEHVANGRAKFFFDLFTESLGMDQGQRAIVDNESGLVGAQQPSRRDSRGG